MANTGTFPYALIDVSLTARATQLLVAAEGHASQALALDPSAENAGLPRILVLRWK